SAPRGAGRSATVFRRTAADGKTSENSLSGCQGVEGGARPADGGARSTSREDYRLGADARQSLSGTGRRTMLPGSARLTPRWADEGPTMPAVTLTERTELAAGQRRVRALSARVEVSAFRGRFDLSRTDIDARAQFEALCRRGECPLLSRQRDVWTLSGYAKGL